MYRKEIFMAKNKNNASSSSKNATSGSSKNSASGSSKNSTGGSFKNSHAQVPDSGPSRSGPGGE